jgi:hypothetical protein
MRLEATNHHLYHILRHHPFSFVSLSSPYLYIALSFLRLIKQRLKLPFLLQMEQFRSQSCHPSKKIKTPTAWERHSIHIAI